MHEIIEADQDEQACERAPERSGDEVERVRPHRVQHDRGREHPGLHHQEVMRLRAGGGAALVHEVAETEKDHRAERVSDSGGHGRYRKHSWSSRLGLTLFHVAGQNDDLNGVISRRRIPADRFAKAETAPPIGAKERSRTIALYWKLDSHPIYGDIFEQWCCT